MDNIIYETGIGLFIQCGQHNCTHLVYKESVYISGDPIVAVKVAGYSDKRVIIYASELNKATRYKYLDGISGDTATFHWINWFPVKEYIPEPITLKELETQVVF